MREVTGAPRLDDEPDYSTLARLRRGLQSLEAYVERTASSAGCSAAMYHLLLAVKTARRGRGTDIGMLATTMQVRHPSAAEMVRKASGAGFVKTLPDPEDGRRVLVELTPEGEQTLETVAAAHADELRRLRAGFSAALADL